MADENKLNELADSIGKSVHDIQERMDALTAEGKSNSEGMVALKTELDNALGKFEETKGAIEAEKASREALELAMARGSSNGKKDGFGTDAYKKSFRDYLKSDRPVDPETLDAEQVEYAKAAGLDEDGILEFKAHMVGSNPDGGYLVPADVRSEIIRRVYELSPMRSVARVETTVRDKVTYPIFDDVSTRSGWVGELDLRSDTATPKIAELDFDVHELYSMPPATTKMLQDASTNVEQFIRTEVANDFARQESEAFMLGDGVKKPRGVLDYATVDVEKYERGKLGAKDTATAGAIDADDFIKFRDHLLEAYQGNSVWMMNRQTFSTIATLKAGTSGEYLLNPRVLFEGVDPQLLGRPVLFSPDMYAATTATGLTTTEKVALYGDFREGYLIVDRLGITVLRDPYTDKRFVKFYTTKRVGGGVRNFQAIKVLAVQ